MYSKCVVVIDDCILYEQCMLSMILQVGFEDRLIEILTIYYILLLLFMVVLDVIAA